MSEIIRCPVCRQEYELISAFDNEEEIVKKVQTFFQLPFPDYEFDDPHQIRRACSLHQLFEETELRNLKYLSLRACKKI